MTTSSEHASVESATAENYRTFENSSHESLNSNDADLISQIKSELGGATYYSDKIFDDLYPPILSEASFCDEFLKEYPGFISSSTTGASGFYEPLVVLLNNIKQHMEQRKLLEHSIYRDVAFEVYDTEMVDSPNEQLKPHIIARIPSSLTPASWKEVEFFIQADSNFPLLVAHAATYVKAIFESQRNRLFVLGIFFEHHTCEITFGIFHASGLIFPKKRYKLDDVQGYRDFIFAMVCVYSSSRRWRAGYDETCNNDECRILGIGLYSYVENLSYHAKVGGRRTRVDKMKLRDATKLEVYDNTEPRPETKRTLSQTTSVHTPGNIHNDDFQPPSKKIKSERASVPADLSLVPSSDRQYENAPETLILKDSWPLSSRWNTESKMFQETKGYFGIQEAYPGYKVIHSNNVGFHEKPGADFFFRDDLEIYDLWECTTLRDLEFRVHVRLPIVTEGVPLTAAGSPRVLLLGILHGMVGHWHLLKTGWLHRDVSIGNILLRKTAVSGLKIEGLNLDENSLKMYFSECTSFIADGDLAVRWQEEEDMKPSPKGTPPFMSVEMLATIAYPSVVKTPYIHTAVDDLESFIWVLIWALIKIVPKETWSALEMYIQDTFDVGTGHRLFGKKAVLPLLLRDQRSGSIDDSCISTGFRIFSPLLIDWITESERVATDLTKNKTDHPRPLEFYQQIYTNYIRLALNLIDQLPEDWSYCNEPQA